MAERENVVRIKAELGVNNDSAAKAADTFAKRIEDSMKKNFGFFSQGKNKDGAGSISQGIVAGMAAGGVIALLKIIADSLMDMPIVVGILKLLKVIILMLFMPLIPVLKPVLLLLAEMAKILGKIMPSTSTAQDVSSIVGSIIGAIVGAIAGGPFGAALGAAVGAAVGSMIPKAIQGVDNLFTIASAWIDKLLSVFGINMDSVRRVINTFIYVTIPEFFTVTVPLLFSQALGTIKDVGMLIYNTIIMPGFLYLASAGQQLWENIISPAFNYLKDVGVWIWNIIKSPFVLLAGKISSLFSKIKNTTSSIFGGRISDGIVQNGKIITTDPADYIVATKNPQSLGGGMNLTVNIDRPMVSSQSDIKNLVRQIEQELSKATRRYNSYV